MAQKPSIPRGTRDFGPVQMARRNYIFNTIRSTFEKFGYMPLETPSMENLTVLTGKYGDEGDQLLFKILNNGLNDPKNINKAKEAFEQVLQGKNDPDLTERALRYDLTVPFARYVVMNQHELTFPFRRYQIQPVWRADRPQKGRYREFFQCDADVIGTDSLICEAEIVLMITEVFSNLKLNDYVIKINNRKILSGITEAIGAAGKEADFCVAIDKLDKIGSEGVFKELAGRGFSSAAIEQLQPLLAMQENRQTSLDKLEDLLSSSETGKQGLNELREVFSLLGSFGAKDLQLELDITLARGLSYYTGAIFEVKPTSVQMGSISGGGRYDDLTGVFGLSGMSGVGFSFGVDRVYDVLDELNLFPEESTVTTQVLIVNFGKEAYPHSLSLLQELRSQGIRSEIYPEDAKMKKQMAYANKKNISFVIMQGEEEITRGEVTLKNMHSGEQKNLKPQELAGEIKK